MMLHNRILFFVFTFLAIFYSLVKADDDLYEVDGAGNSDLQKRKENYKPVTFQNNYDNQSIVLFWEDANGSRVKMGNIIRNSDAKINSYVNHRFFASTDENGDDRVWPNHFTVVSSKSVYSFGPSDKVQITTHPLVTLINSPTTATSAKFRNLIPATIDIYYDDGRDGTFQGTLDLGKEYTINTYEGHVFYFTEKGKKDKELARFVIDKNVVMYTVEDPARPPPVAMLQHRENELKFGAEYLNRTGLQWRHYYGPNGPRPPPVLFMWPAEEIGQIHGVTSRHGFWNCDGDAANCQSQQPVNFELEVVSLRPRVFIIADFLSDFEVESIKAFAKPKVARSSVGSKDGGGARNSDTRTSRNTWVKRDSNAITETLSLRAADLLNISESHLWSHTNAEDLQVVHYVNGQKYDSHHDWGVSGYEESRYITLLLYLTDRESPNAGGETAFPKAANGLGFKVTPKKGTAVLFYNLLEDGNGDDLALHAALPTVRGEKWLANFWVWDPKRK